MGKISNLNYGSSADTSSVKKHSVHPYTYVAMVVIVVVYVLVMFCPDTAVIRRRFSIWRARITGAYFNFATLVLLLTLQHPPRLFSSFPPPRKNYKLKLFKFCSHLPLCKKKQHKNIKKLVQSHFFTYFFLIF